MLMRDVAARFPKFAELQRLLTSKRRQIPDRMQDSIIGVYGVLFSLMQEVLQIFYKGPESRLA